MLHPSLISGFTRLRLQLHSITDTRQVVGQGGGGWVRGVQTRKGAMVSERGDGGDLGDGVCVGWVS